MTTHVSAEHDLSEHIHHQDEEEHNRSGERRTKWVVIITFVMMIGELTIGHLTGSMALTADGWHMGTHVGALGLTLVAYWYARTRASHDAFSFGTGKVYALAGYTSGVMLAIVALWLAYEGIDHLVGREVPQYLDALPVAVVGLIVNFASAMILGSAHHYGHSHGHSHGHAHDHGHRHDDHGHARGAGHGHDDHDGHAPPHAAGHAHGHGHDDHHEHDHGPGERVNGNRRELAVHDDASDTRTAESAHRHDEHHVRGNGGARTSESAHRHDDHQHDRVNGKRAESAHGEHQHDRVDGHRAESAHAHDEHHVSTGARTAESANGEHRHDRVNGNRARTANVNGNVGHAPQANNKPKPGTLDFNLRAAYIHILADAMTSLLAIVALVLGYWAGLWYLDALMGLVGGAVIVWWAASLCRQASRQLLDVVSSPAHERVVRQKLEAIDDVRVADLHVWELGPGRRSCIVSLVTTTPRDVAFYRDTVLAALPVAHLTIEIHQCALAHGGDPCVEVAHAHEH